MIFVGEMEKCFLVFTVLFVGEMAAARSAAKRKEEELERMGETVPKWASGFLLPRKCLLLRSKYGSVSVTP